MHKRTAMGEMGQEVQRIGLGFVKATSPAPGARPSPKLWLGKRLEQFGRRLQHRTPSPATLPERELAPVRS